MLTYAAVLLAYADVCCRMPQRNAEADSGGADAASHTAFSQFTAREA
jgi:hypothetical protein